MLIIGPMFEFSDSGIWRFDTKDLVFRFLIGVLFLDWSFVFGLEFYELDLKFANIDVGYCLSIVSLELWCVFQILWGCNISSLSQ